MFDQIVVFGVLLFALAMFIWGRLRYDVVALLSLLIVVLAGIIPGNEAFLGFANPAVITVAAILVVSRGLRNSGVVDLLAAVLSRAGKRPSVQVGSLMGLVTAISGFISSVGAAAIVMPVAMRMARSSGKPASILLMPLAFASLLGAMITLIGSSPNIIIAAYRQQIGLGPFRMFDYAPVGIGVALAGILFVSLIGWRLIPQRKGQTAPEELFEIDDYLTEVRVTEQSILADKTLRVLSEVARTDAVIVGLVRGERRRAAPSIYETLRAGDILIVEADSETLKALVDKAKLELVGSKQVGREQLKSEDIAIAEAVVASDSQMVGKTPIALNLRRRYGVNLLAVSRQGQTIKQRLSRTRFQPGDVLLLQGDTDRIQETIVELGCLPLAERGLRIGQPRRSALTLVTFFAALIAAALGLLPVQVAFAAAALGMVLFGQVGVREAYNSVDWPIVVLLGCMIPVGQALESTGGAALIADQILMLSVQVPPVVTLGVLLVGTMFLSDVVNNAAAAVLMAPIAFSVASGMGVSVDPFLMAVAIGSSAAFLTPIGHQANTLVLGPGGYRFGDYWRLGLPLELVIIAVAMPLILWFWPL